MNGNQRAGDRLFWGVMWASAALTVITLVASQFVAAPPGIAGAAGALPRMGRPPANTGELLRSLGVGTLIWYSCFVSAPLFIWMSRRLPFSRAGWMSSLAAHVVAIGMLASVNAWLQYHVTYRGARSAPELGAYLRLGIIAGALPLLTVAAAAHALEARARAHERELETQRIRSHLAEARLSALTAQLQPHFLFNTLQAISTLITMDPTAANAMLASLSDLLREVLRRGEEREVELQEELRILDAYLDISRRRFGERLTLKVTAGDETGRGLVPFFILQPLVENALFHGIGSHAAAGTVQITARRTAERLVLAVTDDGPGEVMSDTHRGIGLVNTRARLEELYGARQSLTLEHPPEGGFRVSIVLPYHERPSALSAV